MGNARNSKKRLMFIVMPTKKIDMRVITAESDAEHEHKLRHVLEFYDVRLSPTIFERINRKK